MLFQIKSYLNFLYKSTNQHGVHSPFVFDLVTKCFYKKSDSAHIAKTKNYRKNLYKNKQVIDVKDFGKGSRIFKSNFREVRKIAKVAGISKKRAALLIRFVTYLKPANILEVGTSLGIGTASLSIGNPSANIITLEGCPNTVKIAQQNFNKYSLDNITSSIGNFENTLPLVTINKKFDLIYFDGNHQKEATLRYFEQCLDSIHNETVFIFDDIHWSTGMTEAWDYIKKHPKVIVTIDTYFWGFVFFRKEQVKEDFIIRI